MTALPSWSTVWNWSFVVGISVFSGLADARGFLHASRIWQDDRFVLTETFTTGEQYGFPVAKGKGEVLEFVNDGLATLRSDGRFDEIYATYFGENE